jgi:hypothetical protein
MCPPEIRRTHAETHSIHEWNASRHRLCPSRLLLRRRSLLLLRLCRRRCCSRLSRRRASRDRLRLRLGLRSRRRSRPACGSAPPGASNRLLGAGCCCCCCETPMAPPCGSGTAICLGCCCCCGGKPLPACACVFSATVTATYAALGWLYRQVSTRATAWTSSVLASNSAHHGGCAASPSPPPSGSAMPAFLAARNRAPQARTWALYLTTSVVRQQSLTWPHPAWATSGPSSRSCA